MRNVFRSIKFAGVLASALAFALPAFAQFMDQLAQPKDGRSMRATSAHRVGPDGKYDPDGEFDANSNWDQKNVDPGATKVLLEAEGPGVITHMWMTFLGPEPQGWARQGSANHQEMLLRIYYDGNPRPGVEAPVGDFFANSFGKRSEVVSLPVVVEDADSYNCFWRMPFKKSIRIEIENQSEKRVSLLYYNIDWIKHKKLPRNTPYFYVQYRQEYPTTGRGDYLILETEGKGHYVGTVLSVRTRSPSWFGEGDEKVYIDGEEQASIWGTGTEDYFLSAWGLKTTSTPYFGTPYFDQWGIVGGHTSAYRWHINDPFVFNKSIRVTIEHMGWMGKDEQGDDPDSWSVREDDYSSVAYWYQTGQPTFSARAPSAAERALPNLDQIFFASRSAGRLYHGPGEARRQRIFDYPRGQLLYWPDSASPESGWVEIPFTVEQKQPVVLLLNATQSDDFGQYEVYLNGVRLAVPTGDPRSERNGYDPDQPLLLDFYNEDTRNWELHIMDFWPDPGDYTLKLVCVGKNHRSAGYGLGIESLRLRQRRPRVTTLATDKGLDWKTMQVLYR